MRADGVIILPTQFLHILKGFSHQFFVGRKRREIKRIKISRSAINQRHLFN